MTLMNYLDGVSNPVTLFSLCLFLIKYGCAYVNKVHVVYAWEGRQRIQSLNSLKPIDN